MTLRKGTAEDIPAIMAIVRAVVPRMREAGNLQWDEVYPNPEVFAADVANGDLWVAELDHRVVGVAALTTDQAPEYADVGWDLNEPAVVIHRLAVDPAAGGKGIGMALMQQAEVVARQQGIGILRVDTNTKNQVTQAMLPKLGYKFAGEISLGFREGLRFFCYEKRLHEA